MNSRTVNHSTAFRSWCELGETPRPAGGRPDAQGLYFEQLFRLHFDAVWRTLRRLGLSAADADDAAQQVFLIANQKLAEIRPGAERSFLIGTATRVAQNARRLSHKRHEVASDPLPEPVVGDAWASAESDSPHRALAERELVRLLDRVLSQLPEELRTVYVLGEVEELSRRQVAGILSLPTGTVASRLRKARREVSRIAGELCSSEGEETP